MHCVLSHASRCCITRRRASSPSSPDNRRRQDNSHLQLSFLHTHTPTKATASLSRFLLCYFAAFPAPLPSFLSLLALAFVLPSSYRGLSLISSRPQPPAPSSTRQDTMSSSIAIPKRKKNVNQANNACSPSSSSSLSSSVSDRSPGASPSSSSPSHHHRYCPDRRPSLLSE